MFDPLATIGGLVGMLADIVGTTISAIFLPTMQLLVYPLLAWLGWLA